MPSLGCEGCRRPCSHRALAFAAHHLEGRVLGPVDEVVHVLQAELDGEGEVLDLGLELLGAYPLGEGFEFLALAAVGLVEAYPPLDRLGYTLGRKPCLEALTVGDIAALIGPSNMGYVGRNRVL